MEKSKRTTYRANETKRWFFEKINKMHKPLPKLTKRKKSQINRISYHKEDITTEKKGARGRAGEG
jgi:hypothetical protein